MRRPSARMTPNTVTIAAWTGWGRDAAGGRSPTYGDPGAAIACSVQEQGAEMRDDDNGKLQHVIMYKVYFHDDPLLRLRDRILWGSRTLTVTGVPPDAAGHARSWVIDAEELPVP